jgi:carboxypeptidase family protein
MRKGLAFGRFPVVCLLAAASVWGQAGTNSGVIAGEVDDSSGAKVPGAKVEVSSPALIEQARQTVTGDDGLYRIVNLPPGVYSVTATQSGFSTSKREGIEITTGFTATVNFNLTPGSVTQTVTVTTEAPVLDTQDSVVQKIVSNAVLEALPIGKSASDYPALLPGAIAPAANQDVGGLKGEQSQGFRIHGSAPVDFTQLRDGMYYGAMTGGGSNQLSSNNPTATQEVQMETAGYTAEDWNNGGHVNIIPKSGGNDLHGAFQADFGSKALQSGNVTPALQGLGVPSPSSIRSLYEVAGGVGGPIKKDKLWFFADARHWISSSDQAGANFFYDANEAAAFPNNLYYAADASRPAYDVNTYTDVGLRLTWQATKRNQFTENFIQERNCNCYYTISSGLLAPEATTHHWYVHDWRNQATWTFPASNKLVLWAGVTAVVSAIDARSSGETPTSFAVTDSSANFTYGANGTALNAGGTYGLTSQTQLNGNFTASYTTGPHSFKFGVSEMDPRGSRAATFSNLAGANGFPYGVQLQMSCQTITTTAGAPYPASLLSAAGLPTTPYKLGGRNAPAGQLAAPTIAPTTLNSLSCPVVPGVSTQALLPSQIVQFLAPVDFALNEADHALFAQDQWRIKRLTLNLGLRFDWFQGKDPAQTEPAQPQYGLAAKSFDAVHSAADWKDLNPRVGVAYDLFGNGKTALKVSVSRGVLTEGLSTGSNITLLTNPVNELAATTTRSWADFSGTFNPLNDGANFTLGAGSGTSTQPGAVACNSKTGLNCALGPANTAGFYNQSIASVTYANNVTHGFQNRPYDWMLSASVEQEVVRNVAVSIGYYRTWFGNLTVAQNTAIPATGYDQYCVTPPASTAYPGFGGTQLCNLYDPQPQYRGAATYLVQKASAFGKESDVYTGFDATVNARFHGLILQGGVTAGHEVTNYCVQVNSPEDLFWVSNPSPGASSILEFSNNNATNVSNVQGNINPLVNDAAPCYINPPWYQNLQFKMIAVYTLPWWKIRLSADEQNLPSIPLQGTYSFRSTDVSFINPTSGHTTLVGCALCKAEVVAPQTVFPFGRDNQLDFRLARDFSITERWKIEPTADFYNIFNANPILTVGTAYNTSAPGTPGAWRNATSILPGRVIKFGVHLDF